MMVDINKLKLLGDEWQKGDYHKIYFNDLTELYGLTADHYKTGNIKQAWLDGEQISNSKASRIATQISGGKIWYDVKEKTFSSKSINKEYYDKIIAEINKRCA